jgi:hypothetical protein
MPSPHLRLLAALLLFPWLSLTVARAAGASGTITGIVSNAATGDLLAGARVQVNGTAGETTSERGGGFTLSAPAGAQTLIVSFSGLETNRLAVTVPAGGTATVEAKLEAGIYRLEKFTGSGLRAGKFWF